MLKLVALLLAMLFVSSTEFCLFMLLCSQVQRCRLLYLGLLEDSMGIAFSVVGFLGGNSSFCEVIVSNFDPLLEA